MTEHEITRACLEVSLDYLIQTALLLRSAVMVGTPTPVHRSMWRWMTAPPQIGDLVLETSSLKNDDPSRIGIVTRCSHDKVWIETLDGFGCCWENAVFVRLPKNDQQRREAKGFPVSPTEAITL